MLMPVSDRAYYKAPRVWVAACAGTTPVMMHDRAFESMVYA